MRMIALEEHFATPAFLDGPDCRLKERAQQFGGRFAALIAQLVDIGDGRVSAMDAAGVDMQALSLTAPGVEQLDVEEAKSFARESNAFQAQAIRSHPTRFFGLAALPIADPLAAVAELERVVGEHGVSSIYPDWCRSLPPVNRLELIQNSINQGFRCYTISGAFIDQAE